jgi:hypothetical protein
MENGFMEPACPPIRRRLRDEDHRKRFHRLAEEESHGSTRISRIIESSLFRIC